ncbi:MAG: hypothetical protein KAR11_09305, partial [Phycisphaerae bacterium]|nr:hypothetical protein [Phycisphaerae bacterium]
MFFNRRIFGGVIFVLMAALRLGAAEPVVGVPKVDESLGAERWNCSFVVAAKMPGAVVAHTATVLADGKVLVTGGYGKLFGLLPVASTMGRIYDPEKDSWRVLKNSLKLGRLGHAAVR